MGKPLMSRGACLCSKVRCILELSTFNFNIIPGLQGLVGAMVDPMWNECDKLLVRFGGQS